MVRPPESFHSVINNVDSGGNCLGLSSGSTTYELFVILGKLFKLFKPSISIRFFYFFFTNITSKVSSLIRSVQN